MEDIISQSLHNNLKNFITAVKQYSLNHNEPSSKAVLCSLQVRIKSEVLIQCHFCCPVIL